MLTARFYQPNSAKSIAANPRVDQGYLVVDDDWAFPLDRLQLEISGHDGDKLLIKDMDNGAALLFDNQEILHVLSAEGDKQLHERCKFLLNRLAGHKGRNLKYWATVAGITVGVILIGNLAFNCCIDFACMHFDPKLEASIGKSATKSSKWDYKSTQIERLNRIGGNLASQLDSSPFPFEFHVKKDLEINAAAYPGGVVEVNQGLLNVASDEELAGVLGHEMGHVLHHDTLHRVLRDMGAKSILMMIGGFGSDGIEKIAEALAVAQRLDSIRFSRGQEADADIVGVDLAVKAGYKGSGLIEFFERMKKLNGKEDKMLAILSDHPLDSERVEAVKKEIARLKNVASSSTPATP